MTVPGAVLVTLEQEGQLLPGLAMDEPVTVQAAPSLMSKSKPNATVLDSALKVHYRLQHRYLAGCGVAGAVARQYLSHCRLFSLVTWIQINI